MLKIHSFLQRALKPVKAAIPLSGGNKAGIAAVGLYLAVACFLLLSPDAIYDHTAVQKSPVYTTGNETTEVDRVAEETAIEASSLKAYGTQSVNPYVFFIKNITVSAAGNDSVNFTLDNEEKTVSYLKMAAAKKTVQEINSTSVTETVQLPLAAIEEKTADKISKVVEDNSAAKKAAQIEQAAQEAKVAKAATTAQTVKTAQAAKDTASSKVDSSSTKEKTVAKTVKSTSAKKTEYKVKLSDEEIEVLQRIVEAEATGEDTKGKMLVANVILNRVNNKDFPDTVKAVVFQKDGSTYQFSPIKDGRYYSVKVSESTKKAVKRVLKGEDDSQGALYFSARIRADKSSMSWFDRHLTFLFKYGGHEFFK